MQVSVDSSEIAVEVVSNTVSIDVNTLQVNVTVPCNMSQIEISTSGTQGQKGDKGDKGDTGEQGPAGIIQLSNTTITTLNGYVYGNGNTLSADPLIDGGNF
jgi:hypothetical protein